MAERRPVRLLEPLCAFLSVCAVITLIAFPSASAPAAPDAEVADGLDRLRTAIWHYSVEHGDDQGPVLPARDGSAKTLLAQLTRPSDLQGRTATPPGGADRRWFGPYLRELPVNPRNGLATVRVAPLTATAVTPDGSAGWVYLPSTGEIRADLPWSDSRGVAYSEY